MSKFYEAIKYGSRVSNKLLSIEFYSKVDTFLFCYKKEFAEAKKEGNTDKKEADAINSTLFKLLLQWSVEEGNLFVWCFALLMWNLMARSINIDCLSLHNLKRGISDSIVFKYDETKMDKTGEFVQEKNCYSNPLKGQEHFCLFTALGCYLSVNQERLSCTEKIFINPGAELRTASQSFGRQISEMTKRHADVVRNFCRLSHFNIHGLRKGSGTHAASATTCPPLFTSIAARGEWSMGKVLDVYFQFASGGDFYLGQLLSLKDPNSVEFDCPCPHWRDPNDPVVEEALHLTFGRILMEHGTTTHDPQGVLSILLASMVHHSNWMLGVLEVDPSHPFGKLPILSSPLLQELKIHHLTLQLNDHVPTTTGIPPHVAHLRKITTVEGCCHDIKAAVMEFKSELRDSISQAIDDKVEDSGGINASILDSRILALEERLVTRLDQMGTITLPESRVDVNGIDACSAPIVAKANEFFYRSKYWCIPENFQFPRETNRLNGWRMWLCGTVVVSDTVTYKVKPFRSLQGIDFAVKAVEREFTTKWKPIFKLMEQYPGFEVPALVDDAFVKSSFLAATEYLKSRVGYVWRRAKDERMLSSYAIGTWSKYVQRSEIEKHGTRQDKLNLPQATARNQADKRKRVFTIVGDARGDSRIRVNKVARVTLRRSMEREAVVDAFEGAFGGV
jgi:hypothetical protein